MTTFWKPDWPSPWAVGLFVLVTVAYAIGVGVLVPMINEVHVEDDAKIASVHREPDIAMLTMTAIEKGWESCAAGNSKNDTMLYWSNRLYGPCSICRDKGGGQ